MSETEPPPEPIYWIGVQLRETPKPDPTAAKPLDRIAKALAGGYAVVTVILTTLGTLEGGLGRLLLNHPWQTLVGLALSLAGVVLAFAAAYLMPQPQEKPENETQDQKDTRLNKEKLWHEKRVLAVVGALGLFVGGIFLVVWVGTTSISENERPTITTKATTGADGSQLEAHVTAVGVQSDEWVYLSVNGFSSNLDEAAQSTQNEKGGAASETEDPVKGIPLYQTRAGPDRNGKVDVTLSIPIVFGRFARVRIGAIEASSRENENINPCFTPAKPSTKPTTGTKEPLPKAHTNLSCATVYLKHQPQRPTLTTSWEKGTGVNLLSITVKTSAIDPDDVVLLDVTNARTGERFYRSILGGSSTGVVDATSKAALPTTVKRACILVSTISADDAASLKKQANATAGRRCVLGAFDLKQTSLVVTKAPK